MELIRPRSISPQWKKSAPSLRSPGAFHPSDSRRDGLPSIGYLDIEKIKREASDQTSKHSSTPSLTMPAPSILSPSTIYSGPPPPYSYPSSATSPVGGVASYISPPESRRTSDDDKGPPPPLQSLPSIHEALGKEPPMMAAARPSAAPPPPMPPPLLSLPNSTIAAPRSHPEAVLPGPPNPYASGPPAAYPYEMHERRPPPMYGSPPHGDEAAALAARFAAADHSAHLAHAASAAVHLSSPVHPHAPSMPQPPHQVPPGYSPRAHAHATLASQSSYPRPPYSYPPQPPAIPYARPFVAVHPPLRRPDQTEIGRADEVRKAAAIRSPTAGQHYGESVKRHLDLFELETSLNEIADGSGRNLEFTQHYGAKAHQHQRSGQLVSPMLPTLTECDDMIRRQNRMTDAINRIKDVIIAQQTAQAEQRSRDDANKLPSDYGDDGSYSEHKDGGGGFAGADAKKRRGRNAPPGRCHSCNRAETPEWRRGPDGARTLCNACGLHYAKLTRKMGSKPSLGSSNLRPKENGSGSPL